MSILNLRVNTNLDLCNLILVETTDNLSTGLAKENILPSLKMKSIRTIINLGGDFKAMISASPR